MAALGRVLRWQLGTRLLPGSCALPFVDDTWLLVSRGMTVAAGNWYCGLLEEVEMGFLLHVLRPDELFVDVGANVGSYTVLAAGAVGAKVIAVESVPSPFEALQQNVLLNRLGDRVCCVNAGMGEQAGQLRFTSGLGAINHVLASGECSESIEVDVTTLDDLCTGRVPMILKIDVEGYENAVIAGGMRTLADPRLQAVIMETNGRGLRYGWDDAVLVDRMRKLGFATCTHDPLTRVLLASPPKGSNAMFVRGMEKLQKRVMEAPRFRLVNREI